MLRCKNNPILKGAIFILVAFSALGFLSNAQAGGVDVDFKQASNKNPVQGDVIWIGSILQTSNSTYYEGMSTLQRLVLVGIPKTLGDVHTLTFKHQANKGTSHAYDFLTSWPQALQAAQEIGGSTMFVNLNECGPNIGPPADLGAICTALHSGGFTMTPDAPVPGVIPSLPGDDVPAVVANYEAHFGNRTVKIYGNALISASTITFDGYSGSGDMAAEYTFSWTSSSDSIIIEMAGHLAVGIDPLGAGIGYGEGLGSANISGGPYHFKLSYLDGSSLGSQDKQIKGADILLPPPPVCDVTPPQQDGCAGFDASFTDNSTGGTPPYTYCWQKEPYTDPCISTTNQLIISGAILADAGTYRVIVIDAQSYADTCYAELIVYPSPECDVTPDRDSACVGFDASFTASGSGGTPLYTYDWTGPDGFTANTATINITNAQLVNAGTYQVIVTDAHDCADTCSAELIVYLPPECDVTPDRDSVCVGFDASFTASGSAGTPPYIYDWTGPDGFTANTATINITNAQLVNAGTYQVIVTDAHDCADTCYAELMVYSPPGCDVTPDADSVCAGFDASFTASGSAGTPPYTYDWSGPGGFTAATATINITNAQLADSGTYQVIVADAHDCADTCYATLVVYTPVTFTPPEDDSVHAGNYFTSTDFSVSSGKSAATVSLCGITPSPTHQPTIEESHVEWQTECADDGKIFTICLEATCGFGCKDTGYFDVTVYNRPPELTCPDDGWVPAGQTFSSNDFSVIEPDGDPAPVTFLDINPPATNDPEIVGSHVEWITTVAERGDYFVRLVAADHCGLADTCQFKVTVDEPTGDFICPDDDSVHAGDLFVSTNFTLTYPECDPSSVEVLDVAPAATHFPTIVDSHVEWLTTCAEDGDYVITLATGQSCSVPDTCSFIVTVYNRPPELFCPDYGTACPGFWFVSTDFFVTDPDEDFVQVTILDIDPPATNDPMIVGSHVEWLATCAELDISYVIRLVATDPCGLKDTCEFTVSVSCQPTPDFLLSVDPNTQYVVAGHAVGYAVELISLLGFANPCSLFVSGLPDPPDSGVFDQAVLIPPNSTTLNIYTTTETDTGWYTLSITAKEVSGPIHHTVQVHLKVQIASDAGDWADNTNTPKSFALFQNQPNPFNPETKISYHLPRACQVRLTIYNVLGQKVKTLFDGHQAAGMQTLFWDGRGDHGVQLSSGIYFYRLQADSFQETKKMTLMK